MPEPGSGEPESCRGQRRGLMQNRGAPGSSPPASAAQQASAIPVGVCWVVAPWGPRRERWSRRPREPSLWSRRSGGERGCCCRRSELCAAASPLARSFFKALQPNCAPSDVSAALLSRHPRARPRFPSSLLPPSLSLPWTRLPCGWQTEVLASAGRFQGVGFSTQRPGPGRGPPPAPTLYSSWVPATEI